MHEVLSREAPSANGTSASPGPRLLQLGALLDEWQADAEAAHESYITGRPRGPVTGLTALDRELGGALLPGLHILHGAPGSGKTALALQTAATCGFPALYVSAEMAPLELFRRHTARVTGTYLGRFRTGELTPSESLRLARKAAAEAASLVLADATQAYASPTWIRDVALQVRDQASNLLVVVDSVHSWSEATPYDQTEYDALSFGIAALRGLAKQLTCPVLAIAERNRANITRGGLSAAAGSRKFEYGSESVIDLDRDQDVGPDVNGEVEVGVKLAKNRNGAPGRKHCLLFHGALQRFREPDR